MRLIVTLTFSTIEAFLFALRLAIATEPADVPIPSDGSVTIAS